MWDALAEIAEELGASVHDLVTRISRSHDAPNLSAAIRVFIVEFYRSRQQMKPARTGELCAEVGDGLTGRRRRIVGVFEPSKGVIRRVRC